MSIQSAGRLAFVVAAALTTAPVALMAAPALPRLDSITPDGDLADWDEGGLRVPFLLPDSPRPPDPAQSGASARFGWDDVGLLVAVEVTDTTPSEAKLASAAYMADSVELFLATDPGQSGNLQLLLSPGHDPAHPEPRFYVFDNRPGTLGSLPTDGIAWGIKKKADGYVAEARLPWAALGIRPAPGVTIGTRLYVNDEDGKGTRTRFAWQPEASVGRFHGLTLAAKSGSTTLETPFAWTSLDVAETAGRLNLLAPSSASGTVWQVRRGTDVVGELKLRATGKGPASATAAVPIKGSSGPLTLAGPGDATLTVPDTFADQAAGIVARANGGRGGAGQDARVAFARAAFPQHVFDGPAFPELNFADPARVERLLGAVPVISTQWMDAEGRDVDAPSAPGLYAARSEIKLPGRANPLILEQIVYRVRSAVDMPATQSEAAACVLAFGLTGADTTPTQIARVAERWWHGVRRARGWREALPYKIHVPDGVATRPRPLIVHLHGSGQHSELAVSERLPLLVKQAGPEPIIVYPQSAGGWRGPAVGELIDALAKQYPIDPARIYLIGFSLGGMGSWEVALDQPDRFAAVVPIAGRMGSPPDAARLKDVPVWVFNGADDPTTTTEDAQAMVDAIRRAGGNPRFTVIPGASHGDSQDKAYRYPGLFEWMLAQRRAR